MIKKGLSKLLVETQPISVLNISFQQDLVVCETSSRSWVA